MREPKERQKPPEVIEQIYCWESGEKTHLDVHIQVNWECVKENKAYF